MVTKDTPIGQDLFTKGSINQLEAFLKPFLVSLFYFSLFFAYFYFQPEIPRGQQGRCRNRVEKSF
jgi:hypothetical protein